MLHNGSVAIATAVCTISFALLISGCQTEFERRGAFKAALNTYYSARPDCLFSSPIKFPETASPNDKDEMQQLDALVQAGLVQKASAEETGHTHHRNQGNQYKLTDIGRLDWTADQAQIGYGNFCFGNPHVNAIQSASKVSGSDPTQYDVHFRDRVILPDWATNPQIQKAFPAVVKDSSGQSATATLVQSNNTWKVMKVVPPASTPTS